MSAPKKPCPKHPDSPRNKWRQCIVCRAAYYGAWARANKERINAKTKRWRERNRDKAIAATRRWHSKNPHYNTLKVAKRRALIVGAGGTLSAGLFERLMVQQRGRCACCRVDLKRAKPNLDHIMPLALGGAHDDDNIQLLCETCNRQKKSKHPTQFMREKGFLI